ncbi:glycosyl transferase family 90-domain-containing protein [Xylariomycetidae sp. FL2044]|nr:glycosyl transferase family 90-domain-containing protein [Xylariomycetidae sp. FL2044]
MLQRRLNWLIAAVVIVLITFIFLKSDVRNTPPSPISAANPPTRLSAGSSSAAPGRVQQPLENQWSFELRRDELNYGLSEEQCQIAFPDLYHELDRARDFLLKHDRNITREDLELDRPEDYVGVQHGEWHIMIYNGELYVLKERKGEPDRSRGLAALASMYRAITAIPNPRSLPNIEFVFDIEDRGDLGESNQQRIRWSWTRHEYNPWFWVMPDFDGWSYPDDGVGSYAQFRDDVAELEKEYPNGWDDKPSQLSWRGGLQVNRELRTALVDASAGFEWSDVEAIDWHDRSNILAMQDFCRYRYVAHTEGNSWSGRLRYLHNCNSVPVIHKLEYVAHYYHLLQDSGPHQNYIKVERDWSDLETEMTELVTNPDKGRRIAAESTKVFRDRYLTPAAEACYWRKMFHNWRAVMAFEPQRYDIQEDGTKVRRGTSWERYAFKQKLSFEHGFWEDQGDDTE